MELGSIRLFGLATLTEFKSSGFIGAVARVRVSFPLSVSETPLSAGAALRVRLWTEQQLLLP